jgi:cell pole-organizing protein PopZ
MTDTTAQEPTMEEILASIRRIISEDDAPAPDAAPAAAAEPAPEPEPELAPEPAPSPALMDETPSMQADEPQDELDEILDLTDRYEAPASESIGDLDVSAVEPAPEPFPAASAEPERPAPAPQPAPSESSAEFDTLVGESASFSAASAFAGLAASVRQNEPISANGIGPTIDDLARALLRPMLKEWLDANLPGIVEAAVRKEVERIARNAG